MLLGAAVALGGCHDKPTEMAASQSAPAPQAPASSNLHADWVALPSNYQQDFMHYAVRNRPEKKQVVKIFANPTAASGFAGQPLDSGSVVVMEVYKAALDHGGAPKVDGNGLYLPGELATITVMEKRAGWGADIAPALRNGDWLFAAYAPNGTIKADSTQACFECHKPLSESKDFLFTYDDLRTLPKN